MPTITSKGYKLPLNGERGTWWQNIKDNFQRTNDHTHDGVDSQLLTAGAIVKASVDVLAASWVAVAGEAGTYRQLITTPAGYDFPKVNVLFYINGGTEDLDQIQLTVEVVTSTTYYIYINDNTLSLKAIYA